ncbi:hypothetical protein FB451DRAFT_1492825 [Mycena latifolia]|nr:hypothetical protein FB451DRAFT_1492825 [Mycena latifolia]
MSNTRFCYPFSTYTSTRRGYPVRTRSTAFCVPQTVIWSSIHSPEPRRRCRLLGGCWTKLLSLPPHTSISGLGFTRGIAFVEMYWEVIPDRFRSFTQQEAYAVYAMVILHLQKDPSMYEVIASTRGLRPFLTKYWASVVRNNGIIAFEGAWAYKDGWADMCHLLVFLSINASDPKNFEEILDGVGGSLDELAYVLGRQLNIIVARPVTADSATALSTCFNLVLQRHDEGSFSDALLSNGAVKPLVAAVGFLDTHSHYPYASMGISIGLGDMMKYCEGRSGYQWVIQTLDGGLLSLIISMGLRAKHATDFSWDPAMPQPGTSLKEFFQPLSSIIQCQMKKSFPEVSSASTSPAFTKSDVFKLWSIFVKVVQQRLGALEYFQSRRWISQKVCENMQCLKTAEKTAFKSCSGCTSSYYCSPECQKIDWEAGHREWCGKLKVAQFPHPYTARDRAYLRALLQHMSQSPAFRTAVLVRQAQFMYRKPGVQYFIGFDFLEIREGYECSVNVLPMSEYAHAPDVSVRLAQLARGGGRMQLHVVRIKCAQKQLMKTIPLWSSSSDLLDGLTRIVRALPPGLDILSAPPQLYEPV